MRKRKEIVRLQNTGKKIHTKNFIIIYHQTQTTTSRFAVTVSKRVDKRAVVRNRLRRQLRELFRTHQPYFTESVDLLFIARQSAVGCDFQEMERQLIGSLQFHKLLQRTEQKA